MVNRVAGHNSALCRQIVEYLGCFQADVRALQALKALAPVLIALDGVGVHWTDISTETDHGKLLNWRKSIWEDDADETSSQSDEEDESSDDETSQAND